jgi:hypothetical protein
VDTNLQHLASHRRAIISTASAGAPDRLRVGGASGNCCSGLTSTVTDEIARRLTFAIISHPNADKTTHLDRDIAAVWRGIQSASAASRSPRR